MLSSQRHLFDIADDVAYLNCASFSPYLKAVHAAGEAALHRKLHPWTMDRDAQNAEADQARALFAGLINADAADIAIVPSTSYGVATAAANLAVAAGQSIVVLQDQFPSNYYAWKALAERGDGRLVTVPRPDDGDWTPAVLTAIDDATAIAALPNCHWTDGARLDLEAVGARCREVGAALVVDATQSVGALPTDVTRIRPDFLICSGLQVAALPLHARLSLRGAASPGRPAFGAALRQPRRRDDAAGRHRLRPRLPAGGATLRHGRARQHHQPADGDRRHDAAR